MPTLNAQKLADGLRRWTRANDPHVRAAVELLITRGWLQHRAFTDLVKKDTDGLWWVDWDELRKEFDAGRFIQLGGSHEQAALRFAIAIGGNEYKLMTMSSETCRDMLTTLADATLITITFAND